MKDEYISKHAKAAPGKENRQPAPAARTAAPARPTQPDVRASAAAGRPAPRRAPAKKKGPSAAVIVILLVIILLAAAVLGGVWYFMLRPGAGGLDAALTQTPAPAATEEPLAAAPEPTPEATPAPTPEATPAPPEKLVYEADYSADAEALLAELSEKRDTNGHVLTAGESGIDVAAADGSSWTVPCDGYIDSVFILGNGHAAAFGVANFVAVTGNTTVDHLETSHFAFETCCFLGQKEFFVDEVVVFGFQFDDECQWGFKGTDCVIHLVSVESEAFFET